ncbi:hypothetical protein [uncultured Brevibacterium sp.]|nr:hypothetical protein [uncultured Brevibacterium sp.]
MKRIQLWTPQTTLASEMTVTIDQLYKTYASAQETRLERKSRNTFI